MWDKADCADYLKVSPRTVERLMVSEVSPLPFSRIGNQVRFDPDAVKYWAAHGTKEALVPSDGEVG